MENESAGPDIPSGISSEIKAELAAMSSRLTAEMKRLARLPGQLPPKGCTEILAALDAHETTALTLVVAAQRLRQGKDRRA